MRSFPRWPLNIPRDQGRIFPHRRASAWPVRPEPYATIGVPSKAGVAQLVEQLIRNQQVDGSSPFAGSI